MNQFIFSLSAFSVVSGLCVLSESLILILLLFLLRRLLPLLLLLPELLQPREPLRRLHRIRLRLWGCRLRSLWGSRRRLRWQRHVDPQLGRAGVRRDRLAVLLDHDLAEDTAVLAGRAGL